MASFLTHYTNPCSPGYQAWMAASLLMANGKGRLSWWVWELQEATKAYVQDRNNVPINPFGWRQGSSWLDDPDITNEIHKHLQSIGTYVRAEDIVTYLDNEEVKTCLKMKQTISLATAKCWMRHMDYCWVRDHHGQYIDEEEAKMRIWGKDNEEICNTERPQCVWFHDESTFYANDQKKSKWVHKNTSATPYTKGEGASLMVADFVSADHGWLRSPDGKESAQILFKAGKSRDGYFSNEEILTQFENAMAIVQKHWPDEDHMFIFDNATTHLKCPNGSLSTRKMPKGTPKVGTNWGIEVTARNPEGKIIYGVDGKPTKMKIHMADGTFEDGSPQSFYFPEGHPCAGIFKGMAKILEEHGYGNMANSVVSNENQEEPHPLPWSSSQSGPMTSSAEEEIFLSNFSRHQSIQKTSAYNNPKADTDRVAMDGDEESGKPLSFAPSPVCNSVVVTVGDKNTPVSTAQSQSDKPKDATNVCKDTSASTAQSESNVTVALPSHRLDATKMTPTPVHEAPSHKDTSEDIKAWKEEQAAHYKAHPYKDPKYAALWQKIQEYWDGSLAGATEDLTS
ncbi:uncharacterized protein EDB91DRAFT_1246966 [Suillus paluster]|uniref:uncharacterized protein n=1 Tax=Suillus paluster TaxID=48578 RepID=UPI001B860ADC|nr:uncharacterized protein EDB91DRAFT_1246966 [Suillus paluster]KAG1744085.1 hypothetical protein EDB91DRAFT_1246966 [Suillus paluster]